MTQFKNILYSLFILLIGFLLGVCFIYFLPIENKASYQNSFPAIKQAALTDYTYNLQSPSNEKPISKSSLLVVFKRFLLSSKYDEAMSIYSSVNDLSEPLEVSALKEIFIAHISILLEQSPLDYQRINYALDKYLTYSYADINVILLKAKLKIQLGYGEEAIQNYTLAYSVAYTDESRRTVTKHYDQFARSLYQQLVSNEQWQELLSLYELADGLNITNDQDRYLIAYAYLQLNEPQLAIEQVSFLTEDSDHKEKIAALLKPYTPDKPIIYNSGTESSLALTKYGHQFLVPINFFDNSTLLLLDTGASITTLSEDYFNTINGSSIMQYKETKIFNTANGKTSGDIYIIDEFIIGEYRLKNIEIAVLNFTGGESNGLLGMNVLKQFKFSIDQNESILNLSKKSL